MNPPVARNYISRHRQRLFQIVADLVRIPSENKPPTGAEAGCQHYIATFLNGLGMPVNHYRPDSIPGVPEHPLYWPGRDYTGRQNLTAIKSGSGGGKSLLLSGHVDTVPAGTLPWTQSPFSGAMQNGRLFGRGANDMKGGIGVSLFVLRALNDLGIELRGDLHFETVVDEEFGGCNGTLAARVAGQLAGTQVDAAIIAEPSWLRVCPAQRGGRTAHITLYAPGGGVLTNGAYPGGVAAALRCFLVGLPLFEARRRQSAPCHFAYRQSPDPVPVSITKVITGPWGSGEPVGVPEQCRIEMYWQTMPGETQDAIEREFFEWFHTLVAASPQVFTPLPTVEFPIRWMPGSSLSQHHPLVASFVATTGRVLGKTPVVEGIEGPCDLFVFHEFGIPSVLWGPIGGNTHAADEYVELESLEDAAAALLVFLCDWCEHSPQPSR